MVFKVGDKPHNFADTPAKVREHFYSFVKPAGRNDCWQFQGYIEGTGYGRLKVAGKRRMAHRVSFEIHHGNITPGMMICHRCDNPSCVNPNHLFQGSSRDNKLDCTSKRRHAFGSKSPNAVLTEEQVREIRGDHKAGKISYREAARKYGVSFGLIGHILRGRAWNYL